MTKEEKQDSLIKKLLLNHGGESFGPFFAERVVQQIKTLQQEVEFQLFSFFKKYQLVAWGLVVALLTLNVVLSDNVSVKSILGFEEGNSSEIVKIDLYQDITE
jgi:hypothetical protein